MYAVEMTIQYPVEVASALSMNPSYVHLVEMMGEQQKVLDVSISPGGAMVYNDALDEAQVRADITAADVAPA